MLSRLVRNVTRNGSRFKSIAQSTNANVGTATKIITATKTTSRTFSTTIITARTRIINQTLSSFTFNGTTCSTAKRCLSTNHENDPHHILGIHSNTATHEEIKDSYIVNSFIFPGKKIIIKICWNCNMLGINMKIHQKN